MLLLRDKSLYITMRWWVSQILIKTYDFKLLLKKKLCSEFFSNTLPVITFQLRLWTKVLYLSNLLYECIVVCVYVVNTKYRQIFIILLFILLLRCTILEYMNIVPSISFNNNSQQHDFRIMSLRLFPLNWNLLA